MEDPIYEIIKQKIEDSDVQLFLLDAPTGMGKTYQVIRYIQNYYTDKKIFFIANQLKLLPSDEELTKGLSETQKENLLSEILRVPSTPDNFKKEFKNAVEIMDIDFKGRNHELIKSLQEVIDAQLAPQAVDARKEIEKILLDKLRELEMEFRNILKVYLKNKQITKSKVIHMEWITKLYPAVLMERKSVILLSTKKFFLPIDPIYASPYMLYNKSFHDAVLFIDEVDATKADILATIIDQKKNEHKVECFRLYRSLIRIIETGELEQKIALWDIDGSTRGYLENIKRQFQSVSNKFGEELEYQFKTDENFPLTRNFIFNDNKSVTISKSKKCEKFTYITDVEKKCNYVSASKDEDDGKDLGKVFTKVLECIDVFVENMIFIVDFYQKWTEKTKRPTDPEFENQDACATLIDVLNIGEENEKYLVSRILEIYSLVLFSGKRKIENPVDIYNDGPRKKYDFYQNGFSYLEIKVFGKR